jgi:hypothetical protein
MNLAISENGEVGGFGILAGVVAPGELTGGAGLFEAVVLVVIRPVPAVA